MTKGMKLAVSLLVLLVTAPLLAPSQVLKNRNTHGPAAESAVRAKRVCGRV